jgi:hypothetical protein
MEVLVKMFFHSLPLRGSWWVLFFFILILSPFGGGGEGFAQIPRTISYQGILTDASGNVKPDGDYSITFSFYESESGGDAIWTETKTLSTSKGLFSNSLGSQTPFGAELKFDKPYWLGIKVGDEAELSPRIALTSSGYSLSSNTALDVVDGKVLKSLNNLRDNVTIEGGGGTTINTDGNKIVISSSGTGGTGIQGVQNTNNTLDITNPNGPTATVNVKVPLNLTGTLNGSGYLLSANNTGNAHGIQGVSVSGYGVVGASTATIGQTIGVAGNSLSPDGYAVSGWNLGTTGYSIGVLGRSSSSSGVGVWGDGTIGTQGTGVAGFSNSWTGVYGKSNSSNGVWGKSTSWTGTYGESESGIGVWGNSISSHGVYGVSSILNGVYGVSNNASGAGVKGQNDFGGYGVFGSATSNSGVYGVSSESEGVYGESNTGRGVVGISNTSHGVYGQSSSIDGFAIYGKNTTGGTAGILDGHFYFSWVGGDGYIYSIGDEVRISNLYVAGSKSFKIDHPIDPENKYLIHSCVESSDRMNIYNGNITTDGNGSATVELPGYFETLNIDYRYQLTIIGQQAQTWIESKIQNNRFTIKTDKPNVEVSWQVTGVRNDEYAKQHPFIVEQEKEEKNKGKYLMPELFGKPKETGIHYVKLPEITKRNGGKVE